jgi:hypothetical protein
MSTDTVMDKVYVHFYVHAHMFMSYSRTHKKGTYF